MVNMLDTTFDGTRIVLIIVSVLITLPIAHLRGRNLLGWAVIAAMFPVLSIVLALVLPDVPPRAEASDAPSKEQTTGGATRPVA